MNNKLFLSIDNINLAWRDPNFELLATPDFPFFMRGNIGPAWYDTYTTINNEGAFIMEEIDNVMNIKSIGSYLKFLFIIEWRCQNSL